MFSIVAAFVTRASMSAFGARARRSAKLMFRRTFMCG